MSETSTLALISKISEALRLQLSAFSILFVILSSQVYSRGGRPVPPNPPAGGEGATDSFRNG